MEGNISRRLIEGCRDKWVWSKDLIAVAGATSRDTLYYLERVGYLESRKVKVGRRWRKEWKATGKEYVDKRKLRIQERRPAGMFVPGVMLDTLLDLIQTEELARAEKLLLTIRSTAKTVNDRKHRARLYREARYKLGNVAEVR